jgi:hypothetical protein
MIFKALTVLATAMVLSVCTERPLHQASPKARMLKWFASNADAVQAEADRHCKQFGKLARATEVRTDACGRVLFECS